MTPLSLKRIYGNMRFHWENIGLSCIMHIHEIEIVPVKLPTVRIECNRDSTVVVYDGLKHATQELLQNK